MKIGRKLCVILGGGGVTDDGYLFVADLVHELESFDGLFLGDTDVLLLQGHGPVRVVEVEQPLRWVNVEEGGNVLVVWQSG